MPDFIQLRFNNINPAKAEIMIAQLNELNYEGFEEGEGTLTAFIPADKYDKVAAMAIARQQQLEFQTEIIRETNWNSEWESSFEPVIVDDFLAIRADFHTQVNNVEREIVITPKMSFGTGHHATTYMMVQQMRDIDFSGKKVFDFGTGTGILAILAEKLGAAWVLAIDNDEWSVTNAEENIQNNDCASVEVKNGTEPMGSDYDIILANINKNVILGNLSALVKRLSKGGILLLSGLLHTDEEEILTTARKYSLLMVVKTTRNNWISLRFIH